MKCSWSFVSCNKCILRSRCEIAKYLAKLGLELAGEYVRQIKEE